MFYKETFLLFAVLVAGKSSETIKKKTNELVFDIAKGKKEINSLYDTIINEYSKNDFEPLLDLLRKHKTGKYSLIHKFFQDIKESKINLNTCSINDLENLRGVGKKSSRFFMLYNRADKQRVAVLDVHILKFLKKNGYEVPTQTPSGKKYDELEDIFLAISDSLIPQISISELDFKLWYNAKTYNKIPSIINNMLVF